jgi:predicted GNAT superfamily acetyltransferase
MTDRATDARVCADEAAGAHDLRVTALHDLDGQQDLVDLFCRIWRGTPDQLLNTNTVRALAHSGNYVVGAYRGEKLVGAAVAFLGEGHLHSHITGVEPGLQGAGVGFALKQDQRAWCLERGIETVRWTFDPLVSRNAYFNLQKLGGSAEAYLPDFYGPMADGVNLGDASDRLYLRWDLASPRAVAAAHGKPAEVTAFGVETLLTRDGDEPGEARPATGAAVTVAVPEDIEALRAARPETAARWRYAVRAALTTTLDSGYQITGITRDGYYLLEGA